MNENVKIAIDQMQIGHFLVKRKDGRYFVEALPGIVLGRGRYIFEPQSDEDWQECLFSFDEACARAIRSTTLVTKIEGYEGNEIDEKAKLLEESETECLITGSTDSSEIVQMNFSVEFPLTEADSADASHKIAIPLAIHREKLLEYFRSAGVIENLEEYGKSFASLIEGEAGYKLDPTLLYGFTSLMADRFVDLLAFVESYNADADNDETD